MRQRLEFGAVTEVVTRGRSVSLDFARQWLEQVGVPVGVEITSDTRVVLQAGDHGGGGPAADRPMVTVTVWDFQVGMPGTGAQASAVSGVSWVLGRADGPPLVLPADIPEKWCGMFAATLALSSLVELELAGAPVARRFDVSAADVLRAFADQNSGNHAEVVSGWRRNGRTAVEHGGIYPQGFFACKDGFVAIVGRSRKDWVAIREAVGWPDWAGRPELDDPFAVAVDSAEVDGLLTETLRTFLRDDLLERALATGATIAPVYSPDEVRTRDIVRPDFFGSDGAPSMPFRVTP